MNISLHYSGCDGVLTAPASKSYLQRAIAIAVFGEGQFIINGYEPSADAEAAISIAQSLGAEIQISGSQLSIVSKKVHPSASILNCGEAGLSARMFSPIAALSEQEITITGSGSLLTRPMNMVIDALRQLGKEVHEENGLLPLVIQGKMEASEITIDGSESSQLLTGLLIALPLLDGNSLIHVKSLKSIPYIQMTLDILAHYGISIKHTNFQIFEIKGNQIPTPSQYTIEGDWSGAAFLLVAGAIAGRVSVKGLNPNSAQADKAILSVLKQCGANTLVTSNDISVSKNEVNAFEFDATHSPDLFPSLAVLAACCTGTSKITGTHRLINKESNRALAIRDEFQKLGISVNLTENEMFIKGGKVLGGKVNSHNDHRMAMALSLLSLVSESHIEIENAEAVSKSYPGFYRDLGEITTKQPPSFKTGKRYEGTNAKNKKSN